METKSYSIVARRARRMLCFWSPVLALGCSGSIGGGAAGTSETGGASAAGSSAAGSSTTGSSGANGNGGGASGTAGNTGSSGSASGGAPPVTSMPPNTLTPESAGPLVMRRLTNREYSNIMADLIGDTTNPGASFPLDGPTETGFEAPNSVADLNVQYYNQTADTLAEQALTSGKLTLPAGCTNPATTAAVSCATQFINQFGARAYRRPIAAGEATDLLTLFHAAWDPAPKGAAMSFGESIAQVVKGMLQSPNFLYHWEIGPTPPALDPATNLVPLTQYQVASRLAEVLWESMPDATLLAAADAGQLATAAQAQTQATRMLGDKRAANALFNFHEQWLLQVNGHVTDVNEITKSSPAFTAGVQQSLAGEFTNFLTSVYGPSGDGTLKTLLTAPYTYANQDIAPLYGNTSVTGSAFTRIALDPSQRAGILTQTAFLAANADPSADNPVRRGLVVYINLMCGTVQPPPPVVPELAPPTGNETTRQRFAQHAQLACANGCHNLFDPPGFAFENYDAIGGYRTTDSGLPVDATGSFTTPNGATITFQNAIDLVNNLAQSQEVQWCVDRQWTRYMLGRMEAATEQGSIERAYQKASATAGYSLRDMLLGLVGSKAFLFRAPSPGEAL